MKTLINIGKPTALLSFALGTLILILYLIFPKTSFIFDTGLMYTLIAFYINATLFLILIICAILNSKYRGRLFKSASVLLINIPITTLYIIIAIEFTI